jgi:hypothetical protein
MDREILVRDSAYHSVNRPMARTSRANDRRSSSRRQIDGKSFRLVDEVRYIQQHAAAAGCPTAAISSLSGWPVTAAPNQSISRKAMPILR